jgi:hypothetical protein
MEDEAIRMEMLSGFQPRWICQAHLVPEIVGQDGSGIARLSGSEARSCGGLAAANLRQRNGRASIKKLSGKIVSIPVIQSALGGN